MARSLHRKLLVCGTVAGCCLAATACRERNAEPVATPAPQPAPPVSMEPLAEARIDLARAALSRADRDEAFALLHAALLADPASEEARDEIEELLRTTVWNLPARELAHGVPVTRVAAGNEGSLWVTVGAPVDTTLRWSAGEETVAAVMFPRPGEETRFLVPSPDGRHAVVSRGAATLLCRADTLKPVREIGAPPDFVTPAAAVVFSPDSLLMAHPVPDDGGGVTWRIRDCETGQEVRATTTEPQPRPLAAFLGADALQVLHADGTLMRMPVSPVEEITRSGIEGGVRLERAVFSETGGGALVLQGIGPHEPPAVSFLSYGEENPPSLEPPGLFARDPWSATGPSLWTGLLHDPEKPWVRAAGDALHIPDARHAPLRIGAELTCFAFVGNQIVTGSADGRVVSHRLLPVPAELATTDAAEAPVDPGLLGDLRDCLAGCRYDEATRGFERLDVARRLEAFGRIDPEKLREMLPGIDFAATFAALRGHEVRRSAPAAMLPVWDRLALSDPTGRSWPSILEATQSLARTPWHRQLAAAVLALHSNGPPDPAASPWLAPVTVVRAFETAADAEIEAAISAAGGKGPAAAKALELALASTRPEWIQACLERAEDLPLTLRCLALSRVAWLEDRRADAIATWPAGVHPYQEIRSREDWEGWEQADYQPALDLLRHCMNEVLDSIRVPAEPDAEQRLTLAARLLDPATLRAVGRERYAAACLAAALAFSAHKEDVETTLQLAELARTHGAEPAPCLRAEAMAYTALGDFETARERWVELITKHPVAHQLPGDYAEAAYTSFENADPVQAMQILITGTHRFPNDANFALRAGWVSLLTGNSERAYRFLTTGQRIGYPEEKRENATLLLAIAAAQTGAWEDAQAWYEDLKRLDDDWLDPATIETLEWPDELKASLRQLAW